MKTPILGSSYVARSVNAADNRMVNLYPEPIPEGGKEPAFLRRVPHLAVYATRGAGPIRGMWSLNGVLYVISGTQLYGNATLIGTIAGTGLVSIADNGIQIFIATSSGVSYIYNTSTAVLAQITDIDFPGAISVGYLDGYFVFTPGDQTVWVTALLDGTSVDPLDFASAEGSPDGVVAIVVDHRELWVFGTNSTEVWYNAGTAGFPFAPISGAYSETGCMARNSVAKMSNSVYWVSQDARGQGIVYRANGYTPERVSTHAIEWQLQQYSDLSSARGFTYQQEGHSFYVLVIPSASTSWVYDASTQVWHERAGYSGGNFTRYRADCQVNHDSVALVGDYSNSNVYSLTQEWDETVTETSKWLRSWRALATGQNNLNRSAHHSLQLDCETGVGNANDPGTNPQVTLRWSDDGGHTWSTGSAVSMGAAAAYSTRVIWRRLGMTMKLRDRVYEVSGTDPVDIYINGAELHASATNA